MNIKLLFSAILSTTISLSFGQWNSSPAINTPVCTATGKQIDVRMMEDGKKGVFIAWKDYRASGVPDIYIQRVDSMGYTVWTNHGVPLCTDFADQSTPSITTDMKGGAIVAWSDWRSGIERDLYAQRIDASGNVKWTLDGVGVANKPEREHNEKIISDDNGGAIIVWEQQDNINYWWNIWLQRIDSMGAPVWTVGGEPIGTIANYRLNPKVQKDNKGGAYICWQEWTGMDYDIYLQHVDKNGNYLFGSNGIPVCSATGVQTDPKIDPDSISGGVILAWVDRRNGTDYDIYSQRIDSLGNTLWTTDGVQVVSAAGNQSAEDILSNPKVGGIIYVWKDNRSMQNNNNDIYAQKLDLNGNPLWSTNGVVVSNALFDQVNPNITGDGVGGCIIVWQDSSSLGWDVRSQRLDNSGNVLWQANGVDVCVAAGSQTSPKNVSDKANGCIYAWQDQRAGTNMHDIYVHKIFWNGGNIGVAQNYLEGGLRSFPNPFENVISLEYFLKYDNRVSVRITDLVGKELLVIPAEDQVAGEHVIQLGNKAGNLPAGTYFIVLEGKGFTATQKIIKTQ